MLLSRRRLLGVTGAAVPALVLGPAAVAAPKPPGLDTPEGWLDWIAANRGWIALSLDDGKGGRLVHRHEVAQPLASAVKVTHLAGYATAVAEGRLDPQERVRLGDWERFYFPSDGAAHLNTLKKLGIPTDAYGFATDPERTATLDQMVAAMIEFSDSAAPDFVRTRLGVDAVRDAASAHGWADADVRSMCAEYLFNTMPEYVPPPTAPLLVRKAVGFALERRYGKDQAFRREAFERLVRSQPPYEEQVTWAAGTAKGTAKQLAKSHHSIATGTGTADRIAREVLERPSRGKLPPGLVGMGFKGGSLPDVLTAGLTLRREDGSVAVGSLLAHGGIAPEQLGTGDPSLPLLYALRDPSWLDRLAHALRG